MRFQEHLLILGYNDKVRQIVDEVRLESQMPITLLADLAEKPFEATDFYFVRGKPYEEDDLRKADLDHASAAIILADTAEGPVSDARTVLAALAVETLRPAVYTCVEALSPRTVEHLERAGVDEILPLNALAGSLLARASRNRGVIHAVTELATSGTGSEMYTLPVPQRMVGMTFGEALDLIYREAEAVLIAIHNGQQIQLSPSPETVLAAGDDLLLIAQDRPVLR